MANATMLKSALFYHDEGLCVIPIVPRDKNPAIPWTEYQTRCSTKAEIERWFGNGYSYNVGIVHGEVSGNFVSIDIDHDTGVMGEVKTLYPKLVTGRIEQSGSGEGYHIPLRLETLPDFGVDVHKNPKGNRSWKTTKGLVNIRARVCQTVVPPSIHPTGGRYKFIQKGRITQLPNLDDFISWLDNITPKAKVKQKPTTSHSIQPTGEDTLLEAVKHAWPDVLTVFNEFGLAHRVQAEKNGELRLLGNGGLLITEDRQTWYCFADEVGGDIIEAWIWCKYGPNIDRTEIFRGVLLDMVRTAGLDPVKFHRPGDGQTTVAGSADRNYWGRQFEGYWERVR
jgi:hypothetical protein